MMGSPMDSLKIQMMEEDMGMAGAGAGQGPLVAPEPQRRGMAPLPIRQQRYPRW